MISTATSKNENVIPLPPKIVPLPKEVINQIAAGEVVQRPASIAKELIENSLDANSTNIEIVSSKGGLQLLTVTDDGYGLHPGDLQLAATRFATSKLSHYDDLKGIQTFGFRGEALASASMVSRLTITSRRRSIAYSDDKSDTNFSKACAYRQTYKDGKPLSSSPKPTAGNAGTIIKIQDLFYNVPNRRRAFHGTKKESEEYHKILNVVQRYAIHCASAGVAFICRKKGGQTDLNTKTLPSIKKLVDDKKKHYLGNEPYTITDDLYRKATQEVIAHVFGSNVAKEVLSLNKAHGNIMEEALKCFPNKNTKNNDTIDENQTIKTRPIFAYKVKALITNPSFSPPRSASTFILFINHRLVEFTSLKRALESVYTDSLSRGAKPFMYLDLELPGWHIDVNVHPTKREVAYLFEEELIEDLVEEVKLLLGGASGSRVFQTKSLIPIEKHSNAMRTKHERTSQSFLTQTKLKHTEILKDCKETDLNNTESIEESNNTSQGPKRRISEISSPSSTKNKYVDVKRLVRTTKAAPEGALEPFLVHTQSQSLTQSLSPKETKSNFSSVDDDFLYDVDSKEHPINSNNKENFSKFRKVQHLETCPLFNKENNIDMSIPGAFASVCSCQVKAPTKTIDSQTLIQKKIIRPKKIQPSQCDLTSIQDLRNNITIESHSDLTSKLRESTFVGVVSPRYSLIQWGIDLLMINHHEFGKCLFYQIALWKFSEMKMAKFEHHVNVKKAIKYVLDFEENMENRATDSKDNELERTNAELSEQATQCLFDNMKMVEEYFSIQFEMEDGELYLTGLPILLENHSPQPHGLPLFLLRLATEVDWKEEESCFDGICREIGSYYAEIPIDEKDGEAETSASNGIFKDRVVESFVKHTLYPALSFLLVPPQSHANDENILRLATLPSLYKVFERC